MDAYGAPSRHHHDLDHVRVVLDRAKALAARRDDRTAVALASWLHDAIYDAGRPDNEARSVDMMRELLVPLGAAESVLARARALILRTAEPRGARDPSEEALVDADFSIVGETAEAYDRYVAAVRREYGAYSDAAVQQGRAAFIDSLLAYRAARGRLFYRLPPLCEALAGSNLARERARLS